MPRSQLDSASSDTGVVTRSLAVLNQGIINDQQVTVPCIIKLDKLSQSTEKLQLKDGIGFYTLIKEEKQRYKIEDIRILRSRNRSMPTSLNKTSGRMNRSHQNERYGRYPPNRGSGIKRPLNSSPEGYPKHQRYDSNFSRNFSGPTRDRGGGHGYDSRRPWQRRGDLSYRESRGAYRGHSPGSHYGNRPSYSSDGYRDRNRLTSPDDHSNRHYRGDRVGTPHSSSSKESNRHYEKTRHKSDHELQREKSLASTYRGTSEHSSRSHYPASSKQKVPEEDGSVNSSKDLSQKIISEKQKDEKVEAVRTSVKEVPQSDGVNCILDSSEVQSLSNTSTVNKPSNNTSSHKESKKKGVLTMSQQIDMLKGKKAKADPESVDGSDHKSEPVIEDSSETRSSVPSDGKGNTGPSKEDSQRNAISNHMSKESNTDSMKGSCPVEDMKRGVPTTPVKVHSARKSAPSSALSRTQRKEALIRQNLLKSQQKLEKDVTGSPKARMGSYSDSDQRDSDKELLKADGEGGCGGPGKDDIGDTLTPPSTDNEGESSFEQIDDTSEEPGKDLPSLYGSAKSINSKEEICPSPVSRTNNSTSVDTEISEAVSEDKLDHTKLLDNDTNIEKEGTLSESKTADTLSSETAKDTEKVPGSKCKEKALQKIKENLKKKLKKGKSSLQRLSPHSTGDSTSSSTASPSPEPSKIISVSSVSESNQCTDVVNGVEKSIPSIPNTSEGIRSDDTGTSEQFGANCNDREEALDATYEPKLKETGKLEANQENVCETVMTNVVADNIAQEMVESLCGLNDDIASATKEQIPCDLAPSEKVLNGTVDTTQSKRNASICISDQVESMDEEVSHVKNISNLVELPEKSMEGAMKDHTAEESVPTEQELNSQDDLSDISVDLGPDEPDDLNCVDDDILLEDQPEPSHLDSEVSEISIAHVESQSAEVISDDEPSQSQSSVSKRSLSADGEKEDEPVSKKSRTDPTSVEGDSAEGGSAESTDTVDTNETEVIFTQKEWKEFAKSIKDKYEKLVETFNHKTNAMYEAQARWQHENLLLKQDYAALKGKYEHLDTLVKQNAITPTRTKDAQTETLKKYSVPSKRRLQRLQTSEGSESQDLKDTSKKGEAEGDAQTSRSSGTTSPTTSERDALAARTMPSSSAASSPVEGPSSRTNNLEVKRQNFRATLSKVIQSKKSSSSSDSASVPPSPSEQSTSPAIQVPSSPSKPPSGSTESGSDVAGATSSAATLSTPPEESGSQGLSGATNPMDKADLAETSESDVITVLSPEQAESQETNAASTASGKVITASQQLCTTASKPPPPVTGTSKLTTNPSSTTQQAITSESKSTASIAEAAKGASVTDSKVQQEASAVTPTKASSISSNVATPSKTQTQNSAVPDSSKSMDAPATNKTLEISNEPEVIDLTDDSDSPVVPTASHAAGHQNQPVTPHSNQHATVNTKSPHTLNPSPNASSSNAATPRTTANSGQNNRVASVSQGASSTAISSRQSEGTPSKHVMHNAPSRSAQGPTRTSPQTSSPTLGNKHLVSSSVASTVQGLPVRSSPSTAASSPVNVQLRNVNPPSINTQGQGPNARPPVVSLQHGQGRSPGVQTVSQVTSSQGFAGAQQQRAPTMLTQTSPPVAVTTVGGVPVLSSQQSATRLQNQHSIQQRLQQQRQQQQQQQQISLQMLQQQRHGVHQLPGAAASAAALATRQPQATWMHQQRQQVPTSAQQAQIVQQIGQQRVVLSPAEMQMLKSTGTTSASMQQAHTLTTSALQARPQLTQQQFQNAARARQVQISTQEQIQAQERAHALNQAQAKENALRQQREQEQQQAARQAAARLQSSQVGQQENQRAILRKLQEQRTEQQQLAQKHQSRVRMIREQISRVKGYQRDLKTKLKTFKPQGIDLIEHDKQLKQFQDQEKKLFGEMAILEDHQRSCIQQSNNIEQQIHKISRTTTSALSPQELQKQQLLQQQQQLQQQLQQQQNRLGQQNQQQKQQREQPSGKPKHPADLPDLFRLPEIPQGALYTPKPLRPLLEIRHSQEGIVLSWKMDHKDTGKADVKRYLLYAYQESESATPSTELWKKIGSVDALPLPMACTLTHFKAGSMYHFAVCAISKHGRPGTFSNIGSINLP